MHYVGIDIGSTASKVVVLGATDVQFVLPTGWNCKQTAQSICEQLEARGVDVHDDNVYVTATGYGRVSVAYADKTVTEITCHARGGYALVQGDCTIIDVGGQDTKVVGVKNGLVTGFIMNDKCSAGTGKFIEIMANRLCVTLAELFELAAHGQILTLSSLCTVFAESELINYIGEGRPKEDLAAGIIDSVVSKVALLCGKQKIEGQAILTGGLCESAYFIKQLASRLKTPIMASPMGRYAGALGAALIGQDG
jgi:predicted CoA-substrate-specific enzyme activase